MTTLGLHITIAPDQLLAGGYSPTRLLDEERATVESLSRELAAAIEHGDTERTKREETERERDAAVAKYDEERDRRKAADSRATAAEAREKQLRDALGGLVNGCKAWAADEDFTVHPRAWDAFVNAHAMLIWAMDGSMQHGRKATPNPPAVKEPFRCGHGSSFCGDDLQCTKTEGHTGPHRVVWTPPAAPKPAQEAERSKCGWFRLANLDDPTDKHETCESGKPATFRDCGSTEPVCEDHKCRCKQPNEYAALYNFDAWNLANGCEPLQSSDVGPSLEPRGGHHLDTMLDPADSAPAAVTSAPSESGPFWRGAAAVGAEARLRARCSNQRRELRRLNQVIAAMKGAQSWWQTYRGVEDPGPAKIKQAFADNLKARRSVCSLADIVGLPDWKEHAEVAAAVRREFLSLQAKLRAAESVRDAALQRAEELQRRVEELEAREAPERAYAKGAEALRNALMTELTENATDEEHQNSVVARRKLRLLPIPPYAPPKNGEGAGS